MAVWHLYTLWGDSKTVGQGGYGDLTDFRFDLSNPLVQITRNIGGVDDGAPVTMEMGVNQISVEHALGHGRHAASGANIWVHKHALSSSLLTINWRTDTSTGTYANFAEAIHAKVASAFPGDAIEYRGAVLILSVNDLEDNSALIEEDADQLITNHRAEFGPVPIWWCMPGTDITKAGVTAGEIAVGRAGLVAAAARHERVHIIDETGLDYIDGVHPTPDASQVLGGDRILPSMAIDGCATDAFASLPHTARAFTSEALAQAFADAAQSAHGDRDADREQHRGVARG